MELFSEIGELTIFADGLIKERQDFNFIGEALIAKDMANLQTQLLEMNGKVRGAKSAILETSVIDQLIPTDPSAAKEKMELCARDLSFLSKWEKEIMSRIQSIFDNTRMSEKILGIDLGTTNSLVGVVDSGFPILFADKNGSRITPSVVSYSNNDGPIVGGQLNVSLEYLS